ncbi:MAG: glycosyltransferase, partial [Caldisericia bacterium]|nr:glycosyltransferase [Caldisericia bacterium]
KTLDKFLEFKNQNFRLIVINDNSTDYTRNIVNSFLNKDERIILFDKFNYNGKSGKGSVLNFAIDQLINLFKHKFLEPLNLDNTFLEKYSYDKIIIGVYDADSIPDLNSINKISLFFEKTECDACQTLVRISNRNKNLLAKMQDIEFIGFSRVIQKGRSIIGSVGLGGNGQFVKLSSLLKLGEKPWGDTLTEDLELGLRLIAKGLKLGYCDDIITEQEGVIKLKSLIIQRSRWLQGHLMNWKYIPKIISSKSKLITKIDTIFYLTFVTTVPLITVSWFLSILSFMKIIFIKNLILNYFWNLNNLLGFIIIILFSLTFLPIFFYGIRDFYKDNKYKKLFDIIIFAIYTYIWIPSFFIAIFRIILKRRQWIKTERYVFEKPYLESINILTYERRLHPRISLNMFKVIEDFPAFLLDYSEGGIGILTYLENAKKDI